MFASESTDESLSMKQRVKPDWTSYLHRIENHICKSDQRFSSYKLLQTDRQRYVELYIHWEITDVSSKSLLELGQVDFFKVLEVLQSHV